MLINKKYFLLYKLLFILKFFLLFCSIVELAIFVIPLFEPMLAHFQNGRSGMYVFIDISRNNIRYSLLLILITILVTVTEIIVCAKFRKKYSDQIEYWNLGRY